MFLPLIYSQNCTTIGAKKASSLFILVPHVGQN